MLNHEWRIFLIAGLILAFVSSLRGAESQFSRGSTMMIYSGSYMSYGRGLSEGGDRYSVLMLQGTVNSFVRNGFYLGANFSLLKIERETQMSMGPSIGYVFKSNRSIGELGQGAYPRIGASYSLLTGGGVTGHAITFTGGVLDMITSTVAVDVSALYQLESAGGSRMDVVGIALGLVIFIWE